MLFLRSLPNREVVTLHTFCLRAQLSRIFTLILGSWLNLSIRLGISSSLRLLEVAFLRIAMTMIYEDLSWFIDVRAYN